MSGGDIRFETMARAAVIRLDRPRTLNALTMAMLAEIRDLVRRAEADPEVTAIVFTGEGRGFCSGLDSAALVEATQAGSGGQRSAGAELPGMFSYLMEVSKPVIAAVNGVAAGGGFILAMMSDLRFGSENASFTTVFSKRGLVAEHGASWLLPRLVGASRALDLLWSSRRVHAEEALRIGLLDRVVPADALLASVVEYVDELTRTVSPMSLAIMKAQVYRHLGEAARPALEDSDRLTKASLDHPDAKEGAVALIERRAPNFQPWTGGGSEADMATQDGTVAYILEQLASVRHVSARKMFGEYGLYVDGKIVALICDDQLFLKPTEPGRAFAPDAAEAPPFHGAKPSLLIDGGCWDDAEWLCELVRVTADALPAAKAKVKGRRP